MDYSMNGIRTIGKPYGKFSWVSTSCFLPKLIPDELNLKHENETIKIQNENMGESVNNLNLCTVVWKTLSNLT